MINRQEQYELKVSENNIAAITFALQDKLVSFEKRLVDECKKDSPDREEIAFLGYEFHRTYSTLLIVESLSERNNIVL